MIVILLTRDMDTWAVKFEYPFQEKIHHKNSIQSKKNKQVWKRNSIHVPC